MKNRSSGVASFIVILSILLASGLQAQVIGNRLNIYARYATSLPSAKHTVGKDNFQFPSLYNNLSFNSFSIEGQYAIHRIVSVGLNAEIMKGSNWSYDASTAYEGAEVSFVFISPGLQVHTPFQETGTFNRLKLYGSLHAIFGKASITLKNELSEYEPEGAQLFETSVSDKAGTIGMSVGAGAEFSIDPRFGFTAGYSFRRYWVTSSLSLDDGFMRSIVDVGIYWRLMKNKRYYY